mgnify:CR=1 FL=1|jgi:hypothetical protein
MKSSAITLLADFQIPNTFVLDMDELITTTGASLIAHSITQKNRAYSLL